MSKLSDLIVAGSEYPRIREVGRGAFSTVYESKDPKQGIPVALKVLRSNLNEIEQRMVDREIEILATVEHETLLAFRGFMPFSRGTPTDPPVIVTEFMPKGSLQGILDRASQGEDMPDWTLTSKMIVVYGIAVAMMTLHSKHIIHRDLKPDNVVLSNEYEPKVADFGLSKILNSDKADQTMYGGTPGYMAPEICDNQPYTLPVDVFAYGMLVYATFSNKRPFAELRLAPRIAEKLQQGSRPVIPTCVPVPIDQLIAMCWAQDPSERPSFAAVVQFFESKGCTVPGVDAVAFSRYIAKVRPGHAPDPRLGGHEDELTPIIAKTRFSDLTFIIAFLSVIHQYQAPAVLGARLQQTRSNPALGNDVLEALIVAAKDGERRATTRFFEALIPEMPDLDGWFTKNDRSPTIVEDFEKFMRSELEKREVKTIAKVQNLFKEITCETPEVKDSWNALLDRARNTNLGSGIISISDAELYRVITPELIQVYVMQSAKILQLIFLA